MIDFKERIINIGIKNTKLAELLGVNPSRLSEHLNDGKRLGKPKQQRLDYILTKLETTLKEIDYDNIRHSTNTARTKTNKNTKV